MSRIRTNWVVLMSLSVGVVLGLCAAEPETPKKSETPEVRAEPPVLELASNSVVTQNIPYVEKGDPVLQALDVYAPRDSNGAPVVLYVHGGGWTRGDKAEVGSQPKLFNSANVILVSVNYRLSPGVVYPAHVQDVAAALAWTRSNIEKYGGDRSKIFVMGHSAGVQMAALVAVDARQLAPFDMKPTDLRGAILLDGSVFDIPERIVKAGEKLAENCKRAFGPDPAVQADGSPINHVKQGGKYPPALLVYVKEGSLNHAQSKGFQEKLSATGGSGEMLYVDGKTHATLVGDLGTPKDTLGQSLIQYIKANVRNSPDLLPK